MREGTPPSLSVAEASFLLGGLAEKGELLAESYGQWILRGEEEAFNNSQEKEAFTLRRRSKTAYTQGKTKSKCLQYIIVQKYFAFYLYLYI